jgi:hypothetical protein
MYIQYIQELFHSRLGTADYALVTSSLHYNDNLDTLTVIYMTAAKFKPLIFSVSGFALSNVANILIFMILDGFCLLSAWFCYVIINVWYRKSLMHISYNWSRYLVCWSDTIEVVVVTLGIDCWQLLEFLLARVLEGTA